MKDWTQGSKGIYSTHGASNHSETERESHDYYSCLRMVRVEEGFPRRPNHKMGELIFRGGKDSFNHES